MNKTCTASELLNKAGVDATPHRMQVLKAIEEEKRAFTPKQILNMVRKKHPIDKVTLYRILDLFVNRRIVRRIATANGLVHYEINCDDHCPVHPHFVCRECGDVQCLEGPNMEFLKSQIGGRNGREAVDIDLKLEGLCLACEKRAVSL